MASLGKPAMNVPFILHSAWMPRAAPAPAMERTRFSNELDRIGELSDDLAQVARDVAHELDEGVPLA